MIFLIKFKKNLKFKKYILRGNKKRDEKKNIILTKNIHFFVKRLFQKSEKKNKDKNMYICIYVYMLEEGNKIKNI